MKQSDVIGNYLTFALSDQLGVQRAAAIYVYNGRRFATERNFYGLYTRLDGEAFRSTDSVPARFVLHS